MNFIWNALILINIYALLGLANNLTVGYAGLLNLAIAASFAIGSYSVAVLMVKFSFGFWMAICGAVFISVVMAFIIGVGTLRYKRTSFALASLAFQILVLSILQNTDFAGGMLGIHNIPRPAGIGTGRGSLSAFWFLSFVILIIAIIFFLAVHRSPWALALQAARDDELAAVSVGKNVQWLRIEAFLLSSVIIAFAGGLFATYVQFIDPTSFTVDESIFLLLALVCGGMCNTRGPVIGAVFAIAFPEWLRFLDVPAVYAANIRNIIFGLLVIMLVYYRPQGLSGRYTLN